MKIFAIPSQIVSGLTDVGNRTIGYAKRAKTFAKDNFDKFVKRDAIKNVSSKVNKETAIGLGIVSILTILAFQCIKGIVNKVSDIKNDK